MSLEQRLKALEIAITGDPLAMCDHMGFVVLRDGAQPEETDVWACECGRPRRVVEVTRYTPSGMAEGHLADTLLDCGRDLLGDGGD